MSRPLLALALTVASSAALADWMSEPKIVAIRDLYNAIEKDARDGTLRLSSCRPKYGSFESVSAYMDSAGAIKKYSLVGGSEHFGGSVSYYYDASGAHRFTFQTINAINGSTQETRTYFGPTGKQIHEDIRTTKGEGWAGGFNASVANPKVEFAALCK